MGRGAWLATLRGVAKELEEKTKKEGQRTAQHKCQSLSLEMPCPKTQLWFLSLPCLNTCKGSLHPQFKVGVGVQVGWEGVESPPQHKLSSRLLLAS